MSGLFDYDGRVMSVANRIANLMWLGILTFLFSIPVVTAGTSLTAMYYTVFQMRENESDNVLRNFWHGFRCNLGPSTILWLLMIAGCFVLYGDFVVLMQNADALSVAYTVIVGLLFSAAYAFLLPMQARFENTWTSVLKNSFLMGMLHLPKAILVALLHAAPFMLVIFCPVLFPAVLVLGLSAPAYINSKMLLNTFSSHTSQKKPAVEAFERTGGEVEE